MPLMVKLPPPGSRIFVPLVDQPPATASALYPLPETPEAAIKPPLRPDRRKDIASTTRQVLPLELRSLPVFSLRLLGSLNIYSCLPNRFLTATETSGSPSVRF